MRAPRNPQQATADAVVLIVKERRRIVEIALRGVERPNELTAEDVQSICQFITAKAKAETPPSI